MDTFFSFTGASEFSLVEKAVKLGSLLPINSWLAFHDEMILILSLNSFVSMEQTRERK